MPHNYASAANAPPELENESADTHRNLDFRAFHLPIHVDGLSSVHQILKQVLTKNCKTFSKYILQAMLWVLVVEIQGLSNTTSLN